MNKKQLCEYINYYQPYASNNPGWAQWYATVAPIKAERTVKLLRKYKNSKSKVLDHGCGIGLSLYYLAKYYKDIIGLEIDKKNIEIAEKQFKKLNCKAKLQLYDGRKLPYPNNTFDIIISMEVWEHAENPDLMLEEMNRVLKPDGILHITTANKLWPIEPHYHLPFLSYLPYWLSDYYVKIMGRAPYYHDIHLPTYPEFKKSIEKFFLVSDVTFDSIINYKELGLDRERGWIVPLIGEMLKFIYSLRSKFLLSYISNLMCGILSRISLGWLFIAYPRKKKILTG